MVPQNNLTLIDPVTGKLAFKLFSVEKENPFDHLQRLSYYTLIWVKEGKGNLSADFSEYALEPETLLSFSPFQPFLIQSSGEIQFEVIHFHPDFFCIHKHQKEVACNGVLFNNIYEAPMIYLDGPTQENFKMIIEQIKAEMQNRALAQYELLVSYLKIFLISAVRLKTEQQNIHTAASGEKEVPFILQNLKNYIETHFRSKHSASDYADLLAITPKALTQLTKTHFNKTLTDLISERIIIEAKRELFLTNKSVKEIAYDLGYQDEYYFSRFFKKKAEVSPQMYRSSVGFDRAHAN